MDGESCFCAPALTAAASVPALLPHRLPYSLSCLQKLETGSSFAPNFRAIPALVVALALFLFSPFRLAAQSPPRSGTAYRPQVFADETLRYRMVSGKTQVGESRTTIARDPAQGVIHLVESVSGLFERSTVLVLRGDSTLRPLTSCTVFSRDNHFHTVRLNYHGASVSGRIEQPAEYGGSREINLRLAAEAQDYFAVPYLLRAQPLHLHQAISFLIFDFRQQRVDLARAWVAKKETVVTPAGNFECHRLEGFSGKLRWILLREEKFPNRIIKQIFPALEIELELVEVGANAGAPEAPASRSSLKLNRKS